MKQSAVAAFRNLVQPIFRRPEFVQAGALCLRDGKHGVEVLLVSSLSAKRWILPKGWPMDGKTLAQAALMEAWEEAGVTGTVEEMAIGTFMFQKIVKQRLPVACRCEVFRVTVTGEADDFPEKGRRKRRWVSLADAAAVVEEPALKAFLRGL